MKGFVSGLINRKRDLRAIRIYISAQAVSAVVLGAHVRRCPLYPRFCCKTLFRLAAGLVREPLSVLPLRELRHPRLTDA
jgi:hypothetical protein